MTRRINGLRIAFLERPLPIDHQGALADRLVPLLREQGATVDVIHAEVGLHRIDVRPHWDLVVLKSGSAAALHLAATAEAWSIPSINTSHATRLAQDKLASSAILQRAGLPIARSRLAWLGGTATSSDIARLDERPVIVKAARGSQGQGLWSVDAGGLSDASAVIPPGPYLVMDRVPHAGDDLKIFVAGSWIDAIERPFPARTLEQKLGRPVAVPPEVAEAAWRVGAVLGLTCFGCDFVNTADGWILVDVNAFPGYKGTPKAVEAIADVIGTHAATIGVTV